LATLTLDDLTIGQGLTNSKFFCLRLKIEKIRSFLLACRFKRRAQGPLLSGYIDRFIRERIF
jgi:hypothetical protein